jgi:hypothetical protein
LGLISTSGRGTRLPDDFLVAIYSCSPIGDHTHAVIDCEFISTRQ